MVDTDNISPRKSRILVVDDDETIRETVSAILTDRGYDVDTAGNGKEAITKTQQEHYNLMLVDMRLPDMEGTELLTRVQDTTPKIRKIIITGYPTLQNAISAVNQGADAYIMKPFDVEKTLNVIEEQLEKQERQLSEGRALVANVLFIGAHPDDIELGCGGTLIKHAQNGDNVFALIFTNGEKGTDSKNGIDRKKESIQALTFAGVPLYNINFLQFPDTELWKVRQKVMNVITDFCEEFQIHLVYTHSNKAYHQDHVTIFEETIRGAKKARGIIAYETHGGMNPSFSPTLFVDISDVIVKKIAMLNFHQSQISKNYLKVESVVALAQFRSAQSDEFHYAESFEIIKMNLANRSIKDISIEDILRFTSRSPIMHKNYELPNQGLFTE
jgi:LmbE family N-acetylglucosaminyl deacetylase/ActR/RegA family two-component response regulator